MLENKLTLDQVIIYTQDFIRIMGLPIEFLEKSAIIEPEANRAMLPCDFYKLIGVRDAKSKEAYRYGTDSFYMSTQPNHFGDYQYIQKGNVLFLSHNAPIEIAYYSIPVDDNGFPMIIDNAEFIRALEAYIKLKAFTILFDMKEIDRDVLNQAAQDYGWAAGACEAEANRLSVDEMESLKNIFTTLLINYHEHRNGFFNLGDAEHLKIH